MMQKKIAALVLGREKSVGFPGKNIYPILARPMMAYPLLAALNSKYIDRVFLSTDSSRMMDIAVSYGAETIRRPPELCTAEALSEDSWVHGYRHIKDKLGADIEFMVLLFCNAPTIIAEKLDEAIEILRRDETLDSCVTVSKYNTFNPVRARRIGPDGILEPFIPMEVLYKEGAITSDRKSLGDVYFADCSGYVVRPRCLEHIEDGIPPQKWMGKRIAPVENWGGLDIDYRWEVPQAEYWLKEHGFTETRTPYEKIKV